MTREDIASVVKTTLIQEAGLSITPEELTEDTGLVSDIVRIDSMTFIRAVIGMEEALDLTFGDEMLMQTGFKKVGDIVNYIYTVYLDENP